jgi:hypothetical protein
VTGRAILALNDGSCSRGSPSRCTLIREQRQRAFRREGITTMNRLVSVVGGFAVVLAATACEVANATSDEGDVYRTALPLSDQVRVDGPDSTLATSRQTAASSQPVAKYYKFTREVRDNVNAITGQILGSVWYVVHTKPTRVAEGEATWGPYTDSLEPATYRFRVSRNADGGYDYVWEGRPKRSTSDADYLVVVSGVGYAQSDARHGDGEFTVDLDAARTLDPVAHEKDAGRVVITHDLPADIETNLAARPRTITAVAENTATGDRYTVTSRALEDRTGTLRVEALADLEDSKTTQRESVLVECQWNANGEGRADVEIAGGDVPTPLDPVNAVECWDQDFRRSYYHDSAGIEPDTGAPDARAYSASL